MRDLDEGWFGIGFAKSRGMGTVSVQLKSAVVQYPGCVLSNGQIKVLGSQKDPWAVNMLLGAGAFLSDDECEKYGFPADDAEDTPVAAREMDLGLGVYLGWQGEEQVKDLFTRAVKAWRQKIEGIAA